MLPRLRNTGEEGGRGGEEGRGLPWRMQGLEGPKEATGISGRERLIRLPVPAYPSCLSALSTQGSIGFPGPLGPLGEKGKRVSLIWGAGGGCAGGAGVCLLEALVRVPCARG